MEWNEKLQAIIDYVEEHLQRTEEAINPLEIERLAGCSYSFFQKVFSYMNDMSFAEYVRYRKLTLAGYDVMSTQMKIIDITINMVMIHQHHLQRHFNNSMVSHQVRQGKQDKL